jgi:hypothetical protein
MRVSAYVTSGEGRRKLAGAVRGSRTPRRRVSAKTHDSESSIPDEI